MHTPLDRRRPTVQLLVSALLSGLVLITASCGDSDDGTTASPQPGPSTTITGDLALGQEVYDENCASCHGGDGEGGIGPELAGGAVVEEYPDPSDHRDVVVNGRGRMPAFGGTLSDEQIDAVVRYEREGL